MGVEFSNEVDFSLDISDEIIEPSLYKVILLNDDFTTKDFVVSVLEEIFHKSEAEAIAIMESVHKTGQGVVGVYVYDIASTRAKLVAQCARTYGFPLRCVLEKE